MITQRDLLEAQAAARDLFPEMHPTVRETLDAFAEESAPHTVGNKPPVHSQAATASSAASLSPSVSRPESVGRISECKNATLDALLMMLECTRIEFEASIYAAVRDAQIRGDDIYDQLRAIQQECSRLNDCAYKLWLAHACHSLNLTHP